MIKPSSSLQDLRSGLYGKRKAEWLWRHARASAGSRGVADGRKAIAESGPARIGLINHVAKCAGARSEGNLHAACEVRELETEPRTQLNGHEGGNPGYGQADVLTGHRASSRPYIRVL